MTKREFLDTVFALAPNEANAIMDAFDEYVDSNKKIDCDNVDKCEKLQLPPANNSEIPNSSDTISRAKAIEAVNCVMIMKGIRSGKSIVAEAVESAKRIMTDNIRDLPPEQPERIVRCKDCKHWIPYDWMFSEVWRSKNIADYPEDEIGCNFCDMAMKANDFCSRGERRE